MTPRALFPAIALAATLVTSGCTANDDEAPSVTPSQSPTFTTSGASEILVETEEDIDIGGGRALFLRCWGEPVEDEPTVLLLSGHGLDTGSWTLMASEFANEGHHLCAYDRLGVGRSDFPPPQARRPWRTRWPTWSPCSTPRTCRNRSCWPLTPSARSPRSAS